jgi:hypothetical protein
MTEHRSYGEPITELISRLKAAKCYYSAEFSGFYNTKWTSLHEDDLNEAIRLLASMKPR